MNAGEGSLKERKAAVGEKLAADRAWLMLRMPFIGGLLMRLELVPVHDERLDTAATDGTRIFVDVDFYESLDVEERRFVLAHEAWHCALLHFDRRQNRDPRLFNIAADIEIQFLLEAEGMNPPFRLPYLDSWRGLSAETIFMYLADTCESSMVSGKSSFSLRGFGGGGESFDRHIGKGIHEEALPGREGIGRDPDYSPEITESTAAQCREWVVTAASQCVRGRGTLPGEIEEVVGRLVKPKIGWREMLSQFVTSVSGDSRRWLPPARRHVWQGLYLQSRRCERLKAVVAIDTSGSTSFVLPKFFAELDSLLRTFDGYDLTVIQCDSGIARVEHFSEENPVPPDHEWKSFGYGGTSFTPVFEYVGRHPEIDPDLLIYFTDGYGDDPATPPPYPVLWIVTAGGTEPAKWGTVTYF